MFTIDALKAAFPGYEIVAHHGTEGAEQALLFDREEKTWALAVLHHGEGKEWTKAAYANMGLTEARQHYLDHIRGDVESRSDAVDRSVR
jgi:hypothetical protein